MAAFSVLVNSRFASSATRSTSCSETLMILCGLGKINRPGIRSTGDAAIGGLVEQREITEESCFAHVVPIDFRFQGLDHAAVVCLKLIIRNILKHFFFTAKSKSCGPGKARPEGHMHHFQVRQLGPRSNQTHVAAQYVDQLRQLIEFVLAQEPPEPGHPGVAPLGEAGPVFLCVDRHGSELENGKEDTIASDALLTEDHRAWSLVAEEHGREQEQGPEEQKRHRGKGQIEAPLDDRYAPSARFGIVGGGVLRHSTEWRECGRGVTVNLRDDIIPKQSRTGLRGSKASVHAFFKTCSKILERLLNSRSGSCRSSFPAKTDALRLLQFFF